MVNVEFLEVQGELQLRKGNKTIIAGVPRGELLELTTLKKHKNLKELLDDFEEKSKKNYPTISKICLIDWTDTNISVQDLIKLDFFIRKAIK